MTLNKKKAMHFVGIGGIGMSGIALVLLEMGYKISGSDLELNPITEKISRLGGKVFKGHKASNVPEKGGILVFSSAVSKDNPELKQAARQGMKILHRADALSELFNRKKGIAVTGTHGKTTTTSLISVMLEKAGLDPTAVIGGEVDEFGGNAKLGNGSFFVAEADESDASFLKLNPFFAVLTNIEMEHVDHYKSLGAAKAAYRAFIDNIRGRGRTVFYNKDDKNITDILNGFQGKLKSFGLDKGADIYPANIKMEGLKTSFDCMHEDKCLGRAEIRIPGMHNVLNALAAILVGLELSLDFRKIAEGIKGFSGAKRRFQVRAEAGGVMLIDDYAHHPTEIRAVLDACRNWKGKRVIAIFQPHRYTRTKFLVKEFGKCFNGVDKLILTNIYAASEKPIPGVSIKNIFDLVRKTGLKDVTVMKKEAIAGHVMRIKRINDMILVMGAGNIKKVADELASRMNGAAPQRGKALPELCKLVKGKIVAGEMLSGRSTFRVGGPSDVWAEPRGTEDLKGILVFAKKNGIPLMVMGNGSNVLVSDDGFKGIVINLGSKFFRKLKVSGANLRVGAGFSLPRLARLCCEKGLGGLESLVGIPGTVGGAIYMNAGGSANPIYKNIGDLVHSVKVMDYDGTVKTIGSKDIEFGYRRSSLAPYIILEVALRLERKNRDILMAGASQFLKMKREKQDLDIPSAGCVFKNPENFQFTCGQMIDMLGLKGKRIGDAEISARHANFIVNKGRATCRDVLALTDFIRSKVLENYGVGLELEIKVI